MLKFFKNLGVTLLVFVLLAVLAWILSYLYDSSSVLQNLFGASSGNQAGLRVPTDDPDKVELFMPVFGGKISLFIFTFIIFLQIFYSSFCREHRAMSPMVNSPCCSSLAA